MEREESGWARQAGAEVGLHRCCYSWLSGVCCLRQGEAVGHSDGGGEEVDALQLRRALWAGGPDGVAQALPGLTLVIYNSQDERTVGLRVELCISLLWELITSSCRTPHP